ncbi:MAG: PQQ-dependent catabolism-associated CXXCW motif protein, partial [Mesorhizobium sp.]
MKGKETILLVAAGLLGLTEPMWAGDIAEPGGYRMDEYRAPVPQTLQGAKVVTTAEAEALWREKKAVFFDVMPNTPKPANLPAGTIWRAAIRKDIPGSTWLANVGY